MPYKQKNRRVSKKKIIKQKEEQLKQELEKK